VFAYMVYSMPFVFLLLINSENLMSYSETTLIHSVRHWFSAVYCWFSLFPLFGALPCMLLFSLNVSKYQIFTINLVSLLIVHILHY
jgi:hypothetical protein